MKALILLIAITIVGCNGDSSDNPKYPPESVFILCDSLGAYDDSWPNRLTGVSMDKICISGNRSDRTYNGLYNPKSPFYRYPKAKADLFILALGVNDAYVAAHGADISYFRGYYKAILSLHPNTVCLLPPLTDKAFIQPYTEEVRRIIIELCPTVIYPTPSDLYDGIHYTSDGQELNSQIVQGFIDQYRK